MKVILLEDIKGVGKKDDIINASDGHARNYLFPKNLAVEATKSNMNRLENVKKAEKQRQDELLQEARTMEEKLKNVTVKIPVKMGKNGKIFGSVTSKEIASALTEQNDIQIDKKKIVISDPIKSVGTVKMDVRLHPKVTAKLSVQIVEE